MTAHSNLKFRSSLFKGLQVKGSALAGFRGSAPNTNRITGNEEKEQDIILIPYTPIIQK